MNSNSRGRPIHQLFLCFFNLYRSQREVGGEGVWGGKERERERALVTPEKGYKRKDVRGFVLADVDLVLPGGFLLDESEGMDFLTEEEVSEFRDAFFHLDKDGDGGCITMEEMIAVMKSIGRSSSNTETTDIINHSDFDVRGSFDLTELFNLTTEIAEEINKEDELKEVFKVFDRDQKGFISATELKNVLISLGEKLTDEEAEQMIKEADFDGDGKVNYDDFMRTMMLM